MSERHQKLRRAGCVLATTAVVLGVSFANSTASASASGNLPSDGRYYVMKNHNDKACIMNSEVGARRILARDCTDGYFGEPMQWRFPGDGTIHARYYGGCLTYFMRHAAHQSHGLVGHVAHTAGHAVHAVGGLLGSGGRSQKLAADPNAIGLAIAVRDCNGGADQKWAYSPDTGYLYPAGATTLRALWWSYDCCSGTRPVWKPWMDDPNTHPVGSYTKFVPVK
ncbi:hypothetical protein EV193_102425 [Herbihabitans rhizosphaerae]|uniref:Ricin-type beta-trefoil lectin protein n=1 Tax=Herbihabitans rhizosphaerae TaxID=1872711 RepID=A0A4Q7L2K3_9PSEU|nr:hypothetical protein [Herbihabitans rhizosphaerae]RZS43445.1 hypothetical protein EV193_102425 [Herbihabitans rhizosphaerae]